MWDDNRIEFRSPEKVLHEHKRAPTDESIRLAMEYEEKILKKIVDKFHCVNNVINISFFKTGNILRSSFVIKLSINGNEFSQEFNDTFIFDDLVDEIVKWVAYKIVKPCFIDVFIGMEKMK